MSPPSSAASSETASVAEPQTAIVIGLVAGAAERSAGEFFAAFVEGPRDRDVSTLPTGEAFDLLFDDDARE